MSTPDEKPVMRVRMTLSPAVQNKCLDALAKCLGIMESYSSPHVITCYSRDFAWFLAEVQKLEQPPTLKQLNMEWVNIRKDPERTTVHPRQGD